MKEALPTDQCLRMFAGFPIVLVTTRTNVLLVGMVHYFRFRPLTLGVGVAKQRHSHDLIRDEGEFAVNLLTPELLPSARVCGSKSGRDGDKFAAAGLTPHAGERVEAALLEECPVNIECRVVEELDLDERTWFLGEVVHVHRDPAFDPERAVYCGRDAYRVIGDVVGRR